MVQQKPSYMAGGTTSHLNQSSKLLNQRMIHTNLNFSGVSHDDLLMSSSRSSVRDPRFSTQLTPADQFMYNVAHGNKHMSGMS